MKIAAATTKKGRHLFPWGYVKWYFVNQDGQPRRLDRAGGEDAWTFLLPLCQPYFTKQKKPRSDELRSLLLLLPREKEEIPDLDRLYRWGLCYWLVHSGETLTLYPTEREALQAAQ